MEKPNGVSGIGSWDDRSIEGPDSEILRSQQGRNYNGDLWSKTRRAGARAIAVTWLTMGRPQFGNRTVIRHTVQVQ
jgi:hypothetical protein